MGVAKYLALMVVLLSHVAPASAGSIRLISDTWDNICKVEVISGRNAPQEGQTEAFTNRSRNWEITRSDRLCYRRSANPSDCGSGWTDWRCDEELLDKVDTFSLN
jgi:hypothetical protein